MNLGLENRRALVTGASRGLGRAIAMALAAEGAAVTAVARNLERLNQLAAESSSGPWEITPRVCDVSDPAAIQSLADVLGNVDVLVLNTGGPPPGTAAEVSDALWSAQFEAMFLSAIRFTRLALPGMRQRGFGRIIAVVSSGVIQPIPGLGISNAIRLALVGWAKTLASEVAGQGEKIGLEEVERQSRATIPAGRYGESAEFASMAAFLASTQASYVTGGVIRVDGGMIRSV
jgi:3-oxoacyl-[acyl-carrier protein] reductase